MNSYNYATDSDMGTVEAETVQAAYDSLRSKITDEMIKDGATLWVENSGDDSDEPRLTMGENAE